MTGGFWASVGVGGRHSESLRARASCEEYLSLFSLTRVHTLKRESIPLVLSEGMGQGGGEEEERKQDAA